MEKTFQINFSTGQTTNAITEAFNTFAAQVEEVIQRDVEVYATQIAQPQKQNEKDADKQKATT